jgi:pilus assembly protein CpaE
MNNPLRVVICDPRDSSRDVLRKYLLGVGDVWLEADCSRYDSFQDVVEQTSPDVAIIDLDANVEKAISLVQAVKNAQPGCGIIVISGNTDGQIILRVIRAGAREFLAGPVKVEELVGALERVSSADGSSRKSKSGVIIAVAGASGGVGTTSFAVNLAVALASQPSASVALVDLDLSLGDADVLMDTIPEYTLLDVAHNVSRLDLTLLRKSLTKHESGVYLLPRPVQLQDIETITASDFARVLSLMKASFSHIVIDLSKSYNALDLQAIRLADQVLLVTLLDLPCLRNVVRLLMSIDSLDGVSEKVKIIVNRAGLDKNQISIKKAEETVGRNVFWQIPNNFGVVSECRNNGIPFVQSDPKSNIADSINGLAAKIFQNETDPQSVNESGAGKDKKKNWLGFLGR